MMLLRLNSRGIVRPPWKANEAQLWSIFQITTGRNRIPARTAPSQGPGVVSQCLLVEDVIRKTNMLIIKKMAMYLDNRARPANAPAPIQWSMGFSHSRLKRSLVRIFAVAKRKNTKVPSGIIQLPVLKVKTGAKLKANAAHIPGRSPNKRLVIKNRSHVEPANKAIKGSRNRSAFSLPQKLDHVPMIQICRGG